MGAHDVSVLEAASVFDLFRTGLGLFLTNTPDVGDSALANYGIVCVIIK